MAKTPWSLWTTEQKNILSNSLKALVMIIGKCFFAKFAPCCPNQLSQKPFMLFGSALTKSA